MDVEIIGCREHELESMDDGYVDEDTIEREAMMAHRERMSKKEQSK
jgi:hypothetical protein